MKWCHLFCFLWVSIYGHAQTCPDMRYVDSLFDVQKTADISYGSAPAVTAIYVGESVTTTQNLLVDIFRPVGDTLSKRPLLIFAFGGGYLIGNKNDEDVQGICDSFAHKGYVTASIDYRKGLNVLDPMTAERAAYRVVQDWSAAIRFFKEYATVYGIDTNYIFAGGVSAGSISLMTLQFATEAQRPASTYVVGGLNPGPDLSCADCEGNGYNHSHEVRGLINCWGAISDTLFIDANDNQPLLSFHGVQDNTVPYDYGAPYSASLLMPPIFGSASIDQRRNSLGLDHQFVSFPTKGHNIWGPIINNNFTNGPTEHWSPILDDMRDFLYPQIAPGPPNPVGTTIVPFDDTITYSVQVPAGGWACWQVNGGQIVSANADSSEIDIHWQVPGVHTLEATVYNHLLASSYDTLPILVLPVGLESHPEAHTNFWVSLQPTLRTITLHSNRSLPADLQVELIDLSGRTQKAHVTMVSQTQIRIDFSTFPGGVYALQFKGKDVLGAKTIVWRD